MKIKKIILIFVISLIVTNIYAQQDIIIKKKEFKKEKKEFKNAWKKIRTGDKYYQNMTRGGFIQAIDVYLVAYEYNPENPELNYKIGICYLYSIYKPKSLYYLEKAYELNPNITNDILWNLALAYQQNYMFDKSIEYLNKYKAYAKKNRITSKNKKIARKLQECENGKTMYDNPKNIVITNISNINSSYPDYCPLITADESVLIFTSRREGVVGGLRDINDGQYTEDIFISNNNNGTWDTPKNIGKPLNSKYHDATVGLSFDGQTMLVFKRGDIYICHLKGETWTSPEPLPKAINSDEVENSACFSFDGKKIYFIRGKTNDNSSNGDIYMSEKVNGKWKTAKRLSNVVNSKYDEDGVFMHPDGKTLFFSSKGFNSIGGYDIFKSTQQKNGKWTIPENLGYPVNTPEDDIYFVQSADGKTGYYSSIRDEGQGFTDIYTINFSPQKPMYQNSDDNLIASDNNTTKEVYLETTEDDKTVNLTLVTGIVFNNNTLEPVEVKIQIFDNKKNEIILETTSNSASGKYLVSLPSGKNYGMAITASNYLFHSENFDLPEAQTFQNVTKDIALFPIIEGSKIVLNNIFFDFNKSVLKGESSSELDIFVEFLQENSDINIEISGHTDNKGSHEYNKKLSEARAKAVVDYFIEKGVKKERLQYRGASFDEPVASNKTEKGRQLNRRVEFKIM